MRAPRGTSRQRGATVAHQNERGRCCDSFYLPELRKARHRLPRVLVLRTQ